MMDEPTTRVYESALGMPPLKMVLVHARNDVQNASAHAHGPISDPLFADPEPPLDPERAVRRLIEALEELE